MSRKLWSYNYDFEFELANQPAVKLYHQQKTPWWFLNRSSILFAPLAGKHDAVLVYQSPPDILLNKYKSYFPNIPEFLNIVLENGESNCVWQDFTAINNQNNFPAEFELSPWGWSPKAISLATAQCKNTLPESFEDTISHVNSKETSDFIRSNLLPESFHIPSVQIKNRKISLNSFKSEIYRFISEFSQVKIKHYFGASGRLSDSVSDGVIISKKMSEWLSWIRQSGGILLEKALDIDSEYSIQAELDTEGNTDILTLTRMFSNSNGSYLGNLLDLTENNILVNLKESFKPLFSYLANVGYRGPIGLDLLKTKDGELKLIEINARYTMGRIAYEWNRILNSRRFGFFANFFLKDTSKQDLPSFFDFCRSLESKLDCIISIINAVPSTQRPVSLITILVGANTKDLLTNLLSQLYPSLFQRVKL